MGVPDPIILPHVAGVGGVVARTEVRNGRKVPVPDVTDVLDEWRKKGGIIVPRSTPVDAFGRTHGSWMHRYPAMQGRRHHCWAYERPNAFGRVDVDIRARTLILAQWGRDFLGACPPDVLEDLRMRDQHRFEEALASRGAVNKRRLASITTRMVAMGWIPDPQTGKMAANVGELTGERDQSRIGLLPDNVRRVLAGLTPEQLQQAIGGGAAPHTAMAITDDDPATKRVVSRKSEDGTVTL